MFRMYILCILICLYMWNYDCSMSLTCPLPPKDSLCIGYPFAMLPAPHFPRQPFIYFLSIEIRLHFLEFYGNEIISIYLIWLCKESTCQCRRHKRCSFNPWVRKIPWSRKCKPFQYSCLENSMGREAWRAIVHGAEKSWTRLSNGTHHVLGTMDFQSPGLFCNSSMLFMCIPFYCWIVCIYHNILIHSPIQGIWVFLVFGYCP